MLIFCGLVDYLAAGIAAAVLNLGRAAATEAYFKGVENKK